MRMVCTPWKAFWITHPLALSTELSTESELRRYVLICVKMYCVKGFESSGNILIIKNKIGSNRPSGWVIPRISVGDFRKRVGEPPIWGWWWVIPRISTSGG